MINEAVTPRIDIRPDHWSLAGTFCIGMYPNMKFGPLGRAPD